MNKLFPKIYWHSAKNLIIALAVIMCVASSPMTARDYVVGEGDVLKITVYGHNDLTTTERVSGTGMIRFPLLGQVKALGMTVSQISSIIAELLSDGYIISPQVSVFIEEFRSQKAVIMGQVKKPGLYELKGSISLLELVSMAGGITEDAGDTATIKRLGSNNVEESVVIELQKLVEGDAALDVSVVDGDSIYISKAGLFYVTGEVKRPDAYKYKDHTSVIMAITMAGGFTDKASPRKVKIIRIIDGKETILSAVNMDAPVQTDDVIVVPESFF
ncbi:SLBB domain-containing protein [Nitrospirota bacterium]